MQFHLPEPTMIEIPAGEFQMGSPAYEADREYDESPQHSVRISAFHLGQYPVTFAEWDIYVAQNAAITYPSDEGFGREDRPVINISWEEVQAYIHWLNRISNKGYRLPSEAEWEYAARAASATPFSFPRISTDLANYDGNYSYRDSVPGEYRAMTTPVGSFPPNDYGLYDMHGNVWEWVADVYHETYSTAPTNGTAWLTGNQNHRVLRGGSWFSGPWHLRSAARNAAEIQCRSPYHGFRLAVDDAL